MSNDADEKTYPKKDASTPHAFTPEDDNPDACATCGAFADDPRHHVTAGRPIGPEL